MQKTHFMAVLFLVAPTFATTSDAQERYPIERGTRVRVSVFDGDATAGKTRTASQLTGTFRDSNDSMLVLESEGSPIRVPRPQIAKLEVSLGETSNAGKGAWIGALGGLAVGLGVGLACASDTDCAAATQDAVVVLGAAFAIGALGAGVGAGIGAAAKSERWEPYPSVSATHAPGSSLGPAGSMQLIVSLRL